ncbi:embryo defective 1379 [Zea mays]|uniref:Non-structural maintenance of chromosomes element 1 homolog n=1 Tax=Zea mays TaxID=4577 RepID=A0A1D6EIN4_MAIZE|nr:embryo defective 1379 [Zea mays]
MAPLPWRQRHHTLLQAQLSKGPLSERDFRVVFAAISGKNPVQGVKFIRIHFLPKLLFSMHLYLAPWLTATHQQLLNNTLLKIKKDLAYLQLELRACVNQHDGMVYYGVVNNISYAIVGYRTPPQAGLVWASDGLFLTSEAGSVGMISHHVLSAMKPVSRLQAV